MPRLGCLVFCALLIAGCGAQEASSDKRTPLSMEGDKNWHLANQASEPPAGSAKVAAASSEAQSAKVAAARIAAARKIIFNVELDLVVADFSVLSKNLDELVRGVPDAYISGATVSGSPGEQRRGQWQIRMPQSQFDTMLDSLRKFGDIRRENRTTQDITEEFFDLAARLKNKQETEKRLLKLQQERQAELKELLTVDEQIDRVREEIDRMQGRLNRLDNLSSLATITLNVEEIRHYAPPETITFADRVQSSFLSSWSSLKHFGGEIALGAVTIGPWLPLILLAAWLARRVVRRAGLWSLWRSAEVSAVTPNQS